MLYQNLNPISNVFIYSTFQSPWEKLLLLRMLKCGPFLLTDNDIGIVAQATSLFSPYWSYLIQRILVSWWNNWWIPTAHQLKGQGLHWSVKLMNTNRTDLPPRMRHGMKAKNDQILEKQEIKSADKAWSTWLVPNKLDQTHL